MMRNKSITAFFLIGSLMLGGCSPSQLKLFTLTLNAVSAVLVVTINAKQVEAAYLNVERKKLEIEAIQENGQKIKEVKILSDKEVKEIQKTGKLKVKLSNGEEIVINVESITPIPQTSPEVVTNVESIIPIPQTSPEQGIRDYYSNINDYKYESGWNSLSPDLQKNAKLHPQGYESYTGWWIKVAKVEVLETDLVSKDEYNSTVDTRLRYFMSSSAREVEQTLRLNLIWDRNSNRWLINNAKLL
ncbi:MAG: hypothetical protein F6K54_35595 [Okeania sp. SIO3B5]|uniref:hypothetical protein n=1 Tax=Okeania sp. SIO3B5 TaxID=2607811 RepID=UPI0013FE5696|nr:hypothetical protein [Okeania sp. SIO3B5]NEO57916.1 hypothetical protein [Okeania sp. SIO3B5]